MEADFCEIERVGTLNMFHSKYDASTSTFGKVPISLNMIARPCIPDGVVYDDIYVVSKATPYIEPIFPYWDMNLSQYYYETSVEYDNGTWVLQREYLDWVNLGMS